MSKLEAEMVFVLVSGLIIVGAILLLSGCNDVCRSDLPPLKCWVR